MLSILGIVMFSYCENFQISQTMRKVGKYIVDDIVVWMRHFHKDE